MDDGVTALGNRPDSPAPASGGRQRRSWSREPHHRRRRAAAVIAAVVAVGALIAVVAASVGGGGSGSLHASAGGGFFAGVRTLAGSGQGSFAQQENAAIARTLAYTPYVRVAGAQHRELALTFDDGPGPYTPEVISILERHDVPATFFEVGILERYFHGSTAEMVARGFPIGDHTFSHLPMSLLSRADQRGQLLQGAQAIQQYGAPFPRLFRPPYGMWNSYTLALLNRYRMLMVLWTVDTNDYRLPGVNAIVDAVLAKARPGAILLLHDAGGNRTETVAALPRIISGLRARGYGLVTVPKLLLDNPPPRDQQISLVIGHGS